MKVRALPRCSAPVGLGASRPTYGFSGTGLRTVCSWLLSMLRQIPIPPYGAFVAASCR